MNCDLSLPERRKARMQILRQRPAVYSQWAWCGEEGCHAQPSPEMMDALLSTGRYDYLKNLICDLYVAEKQRTQK